MKKLSLLLLSVTLISCTQSKNESVVLQNFDSDEVTFIIDLKTKENSKEDIESFTMNISNSILNNEPSTTVYGYYINDDASKITLIERYNTSQDALQHAKDFMNGDSFNRFFELFEIENFIVIGAASDEFKKFTSDNGFVIDFRESIGGYVRR